MSDRRSAYSDNVSLGLSSGSVILAPPDPAWAAAFAAERARLREAAGELPLALEHVGSTAIPGIPAKPILDLLGGRPAGGDPAPYVAAIEAAGYVHRGEHGIPGRQYFVRDDAAGQRTHHLHLVEQGGELWRSHLLFRDYLRGHPARAAEYAALKQALAVRHASDREAYTDGKAAFIVETLHLAGAGPLATVSEVDQGGSSPMPMPHETWAEIYDWVYEEGHGEAYHEFTRRTLETIREMTPPPARVVDLGAGTGRLAVPLAQEGYEVTAVEPSPAMLRQLQAKAVRAGVSVATRESPMQDFDGEGRYDLALCVFTIVSYLLDEATLRSGMGALARSLRPGGGLLIDVPRRAAFASYTQTTPNLVRRVTVTPVEGDVYSYQEQIRCRRDGRWHDYADLFRIRYWPSQVVRDVLHQHGIELEPIRGFEATGADYFCGAKRA